MKTFWTRAFTALFFAIFMVGGIFWNQYSFFLLASVILAGSLYEYFSIVHAGTKKKRDTVWLIFMFWIFYSASFFISPIPLGILAGVLAFKIFSRPLFFPAVPYTSVIAEAFPILWVLLPLMLANQIYAVQGPNFLFAVFVLIWVYDTGSYIIGSLIGKRKLLERVSPKKTLEGSIGGVLATMGAAAFFHNLPGLHILSGMEWLIMGFVIVVSATIGDLVESVFKRHYGVKDSGTILPGHGGFLDRFDAFFFTVPFVALFLQLFEWAREFGLF